MDYLYKPIVLVTGFGPFVNHPVNASWEAVKLMNKEEIERKHDVEFVPIEISVTYENVDEFVPALWETHTPKLMIHVGVSSIAKEITIEAQAHKKGYERRDYLNKCPPGKICSATGAIQMKTKLDVNRICQKFNDRCPCETKASISYDAGRYLCEYIYYTSLTVDNTRTIFIHVPDMDTYPPSVSAKALERILDLCMEQIADNQNIDNNNENLLRKRNVVAKTEVISAVDVGNNIDVGNNMDVGNNIDNEIDQMIDKDSP